jgi:putative membrane protein
MPTERLQTSLKALLLIGMALFLYGRLSDGTLYFYIHQRFAWLTMLAIIGFLLVGINYGMNRGVRGHSHTGGHHDHHHHGLSWGGYLLVALPLLLGLLVPPRPLGASALATREIRIGTAGSAMPAAVKAATEKAPTDKNVLDWLLALQSTSDPAAYAGQEANVIGFVYRDDRFPADSFMITRYVLSCCVADASAAGLMVRWPEAPGLIDDQWVEVTGRFQVGEFDGETTPILVAQAVIPTSVPSQPYLYP